VGMYTEIVIAAPLRSDTPGDVIEIIRYMIGEGESAPEKTPNHDLFKCDRWGSVLNCSSYYFIPFSTQEFRYDAIRKAYCLVVRADLKNYGDEIEKFFDWIDQYLEKWPGEFVGYSRYEEDIEPVLYFKK